MLSLLLILSGLGCLTSAGPNSKRPFLEITVPQKSTNASDGSETQVTYFIKIDGKTYTLLLEKQSFLHPHFLVYSYNKSGILHTDYSLIKSHCFYQGYATKIKKSVVTLNICFGLRGFLQIENVSYGIEPLESSATYEHIVYQINNNIFDYSSITENISKPQYVGESYRILVKAEKNSDVAQLKRTLNIQVFMDKSMFDYIGSEMGIAAHKVVHLFGLINTMFSQLKMTIKLTSLEVWSDKNKISTNGNANEVLQRFLSWKQKVLFQRSKDMAYLLIYRAHPDFVGATYHGVACDPKLAAGIVLHSKTITLEAFSVVMVQLIGINLGLTYDVHNCYCPEKSCIMEPEAIHSGGIKHFSSCSIDGFKKIVSQPEFECLQNQKVLKVVHKQRTICGNGILESSEQCDCGVPEACSHRKCCSPRNCTFLTSSAECGSGPCCNKDTCRLYPRGHLCRKINDACDFPEFCNGTSEFCVPDMKAANLEPCSNNTAYCLHGICRDPTRQCVQLFGKFAKNAPYLCSQEVNGLHDKFGNCHSRCSFSGTLCGKLVCLWTKSEVANMRDYDLQYMNLGGHLCLSAFLRNSSRSDDTYVEDGTPCEEAMVCTNGICKLVNTNELKSPCNSTDKCRGHGVCNSNYNCHCDAGYAPPDCDQKLHSPGGSIDDGFWLAPPRSNPLFVKQHATTEKNGLSVSFYILPPFLILTVIIFLKWDKMKRFWNRAGTVSGESTSEDSNNSSTQS